MTNRRMLFLCSMALVLLLTVIGVQGQDASANDCPTRDASRLVLPDTMRFIIQEPYHTGLQLLNPDTGESAILPNSDGVQFAFLLDNASHLLLIRNVGDTEIWQITNVDGTNPRTILEKPAEQMWQIKVGDSGVLFHEFAPGSDWQFLNFDDENVYSAPGYPWQSYDPYATPEPGVRYMWRYVDVNDNAAGPYLKLLDLQTGHYIDFGPPFSPPNTVAVPNDPFGKQPPILRVFSLAGEMLYKIDPPAGYDDTAIFFWGWSSEGSSVLIGFSQYLAAFNYYQRLRVYDLDREMWHPACFEYLTYQQSTWTEPPEKVSIFNWTSDSRYVWWLETVNQFEHNYNLILADIETGTYGVVAENVDRFSRVVILDN